jgi:hypothetical protein
MAGCQPAGSKHAHDPKMSSREGTVAFSSELPYASFLAVSQAIELFSSCLVSIHPASHRQRSRLTVLKHDAERLLDHELRIEHDEPEADREDVIAAPPLEERPDGCEGCFVRERDVVEGRGARDATRTGSVRRWPTSFRRGRAGSRGGVV